MSDRGPLSASRLPDLPNAGYATLKQKQTSDAICEFMRQTERNRVLLLSIVVDGVDAWRKIAAKAWKGYLVDREILDNIFRYFVAQAGPNPAQQLLILMGQAEQAKREAWDKRQSTRAKHDKTLRGALADARKEQKRLSQRKTFS